MPRPTQPALRPYWAAPDDSARLYLGHVVNLLRRMPAASVQCCVTSPPYWGLRAYAQCERCHKPIKAVTCATCGHANPWYPDFVKYEIGNEPTPDGFVANMVAVFREVRRVLRDDGVLWLNLGDTYLSAASPAGVPIQTLDDGRPRSVHSGANRTYRDIPQGNLVGIPWRVALALQADGWILRSDVPWVKRSAMPESAMNRPAKALEYWFLLAKQPGYYFDMTAIRKGTDRDPVSVPRAKAFAKQGQVGTHLNGDEMITTQGRNFRNADLWFESITAPHGVVGVGDELVGLDVTIRGYAGAHFATFPETIVEPLVKSSTSERGACADCGAPWERVMSASPKPPPEVYTNTKKPDDGYVSVNVAGGFGQKWQQWRDANPSKTLGWQPTCECHGRFVKQMVMVRRPVNLKVLDDGTLSNDLTIGNRDRSLPGNRNGCTGSLDGVEREMEDVEEEQWVYESDLPPEDHPTRPCVVLDPFVGSGTTVAVALKLGRHGWGIDLSEEYLREHACKRVGAAIVRRDGPSALAAPEVVGLDL